MTDRRKRRRSKDADARDGDRYDPNGLAMKRLISPPSEGLHGQLPVKEEKHRHYAKSEER